jgi:hypothetical protein
MRLSDRGFVGICFDPVSKADVTSAVQRNDPTALPIASDQVRSLASRSLCTKPK